MNRKMHSILESYGPQCQLEPYFWISENREEETDFFARSPCLEWIVCVLFEQHPKIALEFLRTLLVDTWSRLETRARIAPEISDRVIAIRTGTTKFNPPLQDTWRLGDEDALDANFDLALCVAGLATTMETMAVGETCDVELGGYRDIRNLWIPLLEIPDSESWQPVFLDPSDRYVDHHAAFADVFLLTRYRRSILRMLDEF